MKTKKPLELLIVGLVIILNLAGCRFGNREEPLQPTEEIEAPALTPAQKYTGYYETQAHSVEYCAAVTDSSDTQCTLNTVGVPALLNEYFSNPVGFIVQDEAGTAFYFDPYHPGDSDGYIPGFPAAINLGNGAVESTTGFSPETAWMDSACIRERLVSLQGRISLGGYKQVGELTTQGSSEHSVTYTESYKGDCAQSMADMAACYSDLNQCGGANLSENEFLNSVLRSRFDPLISSGALSPSDLSNLSAFGYEVSYK